MAKIIKYETDVRIYEVEITDEQLQRLKESDEGYDEVLDEVCDMFEYINTKDSNEFEVIE
jgi:hypothetical protein